jgi:hypothetical protein
MSAHMPLWHQSEHDFLLFTPIFVLRMADQVLPILIQVLCWFDLRMLEQVWIRYDLLFTMTAFLISVHLSRLVAVARARAGGEGCDFAPSKPDWASLGTLELCMTCVFLL